MFNVFEKKKKKHSHGHAQNEDWEQLAGHHRNIIIFTRFREKKLHWDKHSQLSPIMMLVYTTHNSMILEAISAVPGMVVLFPLFFGCLFCCYVNTSTILKGRNLHTVGSIVSKNHENIFRGNKSKEGVSLLQTESHNLKGKGGGMISWTEMATCPASNPWGMITKTTFWPTEGTLSSAHAGRHLALPVQPPRKVHRHLFNWNWKQAPSNPHWIELFCIRYLKFY